MHAALLWINVALRGVMEAGVVFAFGWWGYQTGKAPFTRALLAIGAPVIGFGFWGAVDFHQAGAWAEPLRLIQELAVSGLAALALYVTGLPTLGWTLAGLSAFHHVLVYVLGETLIKR